MTCVVAGLHLDAGVAASRRNSSMFENTRTPIFGLAPRRGAECPLQLSHKEMANDAVKAAEGAETALHN